MLSAGILYSLSSFGSSQSPNSIKRFYISSFLIIFALFLLDSFSFLHLMLMRVILIFIVHFLAEKPNGVRPNSIRPNDIHPNDPETRSYETPSCDDFCNL